MQTKFVKLVTGETVIGTYNSENNSIEDVALIQVMPSSSGVQIAIVPYGFPFEEKIGGSISSDKFMYEFKEVPNDIESKYLEAKSNITISSQIPNDSPLSENEKVVDIESLFKKH